MRLCETPGCGKPHRARGYCMQCYMKQYNRYYKVRYREKIRAQKRGAYARMTDAQKAAKNAQRKRWRKLRSPTQDGLKAKKQNAERMRERWADPEYRARYNAKRREKYATDPEYRAKCRQRDAERRRRKKNKDSASPESAWWLDVGKAKASELDTKLRKLPPR